MVKKTTTKAAAKKAAPSKPRAKSAKSSAVKTVKKPVARKVRPVSNKVDYYPNRMTVAVSALAGTLLVLFALIAVLGTQ